jgi:hypothetical protein
MELESVEKVKKESIIRGLYAQKKKHEEKISYWKGVEKEVVSNLKKHNQQLNAIEDKLERLNAREIYLTTHFIERYHERVGPATEQEIRKHVLTPQFENMIKTLGNGKYPLDQYSIVVEDFKLLTITIPETKTKKSQRFMQYGNEKSTIKKKARNS